MSAKPGAPRLARAAAVVAMWAAAGCTNTPRKFEQRVWTDEFELRISSETTPPRAEEPTAYRVIVRDVKTKEPIVNGQGRIFATNSDGKTIWDGFKYGPEVGTYHATLMFLTAGEWAMNVQFRRDSTTALQRPQYDWRQLIRRGAEPGS